QNMAPDDAADMLEDLELNDSEINTILCHFDTNERKEIETLLNYEEDSGGSIMTPEMCALPSNTTVSQALFEIGNADLFDPIMQVFIVEHSTNVLLGYVYITQLLSQSLREKNSNNWSYSNKITLDKLVNTNYIWANVDDDQEEIARKFRKYNLLVMPVVDAKHRLVGRITADDIMDVIQEEADEDMAMMIGAPDFEESDESALSAVRLRLPWLLITMIAGLINSILIQNMQAATIATVAIFIPVLMGMGGNTSMQATAITVREIATGKLRANLWRIISRQMLIGAMMGVVASSIVFAGSFIILKYVVNPIDIPIINMCSAIATAMLAGMIFASAFGSLVPILLHRINIDPAIASGPFVSTSNDISASLIYFGTCLLLLN
ncbi:MAG: magnesium transporter, partial [Lentisphaeria bacterium]